jgi:hypothetical protein
MLSQRQLRLCTMWAQCLVKSQPSAPCHITKLRLQHGARLVQCVRKRAEQASSGIAPLFVRQLWIDGEMVSLLWQTLFFEARVPQVAAYCVSALAGGTAFFLWWRIEEQERRRVWRLYGWFSGLMLVGSCFGIATWLTWMQRLVYRFHGESVTADSQADEMLYRALGNPWRAAFSVLYPFEFMCVSVAKLLVLDRMHAFLRLTQGGDLGHWTVAGRVVMAAVMAGNVLGIVCNIAGAVYWHRSSALFYEASANYAKNQTALGAEYSALAVSQVSRSGTFTSVQSWAEAFASLLIVLAFIVTGVACSRLIRNMLSKVSADGDVAMSGRQLHVQILGTTAYIFVTVLLRSAFSAFYALSFQLRGKRVEDKSCGSKSFCDDECYNMWFHVVDWITFTPSFQLTIELISSPITLLVALWGMTSQATLQIMRQNSSKSTMLASLLQ